MVLCEVIQKYKDEAKLANTRQDFQDWSYSYMAYMLYNTMEAYERWNEDYKDKDFYDYFYDLPCKDLIIIDNLWMQYSYGRFGFSIQNSIYELLERNILSLAISVRWGYWNKGAEKYINTKEPYNIDALVGHLPIVHLITNTIDSETIYYLPSLLDKFSSCSLDKK